MATKASETTETTENREESRDRPLMDANSAAIKKLIQHALGFPKTCWLAPSARDRSQPRSLLSIARLKIMVSVVRFRPWAPSFQWVMI